MPRLCRRHTRHGPRRRGDVRVGARSGDGLAAPRRARRHLARRGAERVQAGLPLSRPDPLFPAYATLGILPAAALAAGRDFNAAPLGNGAFVLAGREGEGRLRLRRRDDGLEIDLLEVKDPTVRALKLLRGEIPARPERPAAGARPASRRAARAPVGEPARHHLRLPRPQSRGAGARGPAGARGHRLALDREAIVVALFRAWPSPPSRSCARPLGRRDLPAAPHDLGRARRLLAEAANGPGQPLRLSYKTSADAFRLRLATVIGHQLGQAGIEVAIRSYDWGTFYADVKAGRFQLYGLSWVGVSTPDIFRYAFHSASLPPAGANADGSAPPPSTR